jgi:predicted amidophosphoribosyltransferase
MMAYAGTGRELVARLKYRNARSSLPWLASQLAARAPKDGVDLVTWVPTTALRRRRRGFDQGELLARKVASRLGLRCERLLVRLPGASQTGLSRPERLAGPRLELRRRVRVPPSVLLLDDVVTTGGTISAAAFRLRAGGAADVHGLVLARRR